VYQLLSLLQHYLKLSICTAGKMFATVLFQWTEEVKIAWGEVWAAGQVTKKFPFVFPNCLLGHKGCMSGIVTQEECSSSL
jgi:hypothetical protein